jgi:hypothetical protein
MWPRFFEMFQQVNPKNYQPGLELQASGLRDQHLTFDPNVTFCLIATAN